MIEKINKYKNRIIVSFSLLIVMIIGICYTNTLPLGKDHKIDNTYINAYNNTNYTNDNVDNSIIVSSNKNISDKYNGNITKLSKGLYQITYNNSDDKANAVKYFNDKKYDINDDALVELQTEDNSESNTEDLDLDEENTVYNSQDIIPNNEDAIDEEATNTESTPEIETPKYSSLDNYFTDESYKNNDVVIGIIDTGIIETDDLKGRVIESNNNFSASGDIDSSTDDNGHGTMMAEAIAENTSDNVKFLPIKVLDKDGKGSIASLCQGIKYALDYGVDIINISAICKTNNATILTDLINTAIENNIVVVASAGNQGSENTNLVPANIENVLTIGSVNKSLQKSTFSNFGNISYATIGEDIFLTNPLDGTISSTSGTSISAAKATAIVSLLKGEDIHRNTNDIKDILNNYVYDKKSLDSTQIGNGILLINDYLNEDAEEDIIEDNNNTNDSDNSSNTDNIDNLNEDEVIAQRVNWDLILTLYGDDATAWNTYFSSYKHWYWSGNNYICSNYLTSGSSIPNIVGKNARAKGVSTTLNPLGYVLHKKGHTFNGYVYNGTKGILWDSDGQVRYPMNTVYKKKMPDGSLVPDGGHGYNAVPANGYQWSNSSGQYTWSGKDSYGGNTKAEGTWVENNLILNFNGANDIPSVDAYNEENKYKFTRASYPIDKNTQVINYSNFFTYGEGYSFYGFNTLKDAKDGYTFVEWNTKSDGTGDSFSSGTSSNGKGAPYFTGCGTVKLYAKWRENNVTYDTNEGVFVGRGSDATSYIKHPNYGAAIDYGQTIDGYTCERPGYNFLGWYSSKDGGSKYNGSQTFSKNVTLYAHWEKISNRQSYIGDFGASIYVKYKPSSVKDNDTNSIIRPERSGYSFDGYYTERSGGSQIIDNNGNIKVGNTYFKDNATLFAHWTKKSVPDVGKVSLTYTPGDGSGDAYTRYCDKGSTQTVESNSFWKTGYHFTYWKDTNNDNTYYSGNNIYMDVNKVLAAQWAPNTDTSYKIEYYTQDLNSTNYSLYSVKYGTGTSDTNKTEYPIGITGFTPLESSLTLKINADGSTVFRFYYNRNSYNVVLTAGEGIDKLSLVGAGTYQYGDTVTIDCDNAPGYNWSEWRWTSTNGRYTTNKKQSFVIRDNYYLTAIGVKGQYNLTVIPLDNSDSGSNNVIWDDNTSTKTYNKGNTYNTKLTYNESRDIKHPERVGYTFTSWTKIENGTSRYESTLENDIFTQGANDTTLIANWQPDEVNYTVNYYFQNNTLSGWEKDNYISGTFTATADSYVTPDTNARDGFKTPSSQTKRIKPDGSTVFNFYYNRNTLTLTYNVNDKYTKDAEGNDILTDNPGGITTTAYNNKGTYYKANSDGIIQTSTNNKNYKTITTVIPYDNNMFKVLDAETCGIKKTGYMLDTTLVWANEDYGLYFSNLGYNSASIMNNINKNIAKSSLDITVDAQWYPCTYRIDLSADNVPNDTEPLTKQTQTEIYELYDNGYYAQGRCFDEDYITKVTIPERTGYTFKGYFTEPDDRSNYTYKEDSPSSAEGYKVIDKNGKILSPFNYFKSDTTIYAHWRPNEYDVIFDGNRSINGTVATQHFIYDISQPLNTNNYTRTGYNYIGWNLSEDGSSDIVANSRRNITTEMQNAFQDSDWHKRVPTTNYVDKEVVRNLMSKDKGTITLYAQWVDIITPDITKVTVEQETLVSEVNKGNITLNEASAYEGDLNTNITAYVNENNVGKDASGIKAVKAWVYDIQNPRQMNVYTLNNITDTTDTKWDYDYKGHKSPYSGTYKLSVNLYKDFRYSSNLGIYIYAVDQQGNSTLTDTMRKKLDTTDGPTDIDVPQDKPIDKDNPENTIFHEINECIYTVYHPINERKDSDNIYRFNVGEVGSCVTWTYGYLDYFNLDYDDKKVSPTDTNVRLINTEMESEINESLLDASNRMNRKVVIPDGRNTLAYVSHEAVRIPPYVLERLSTVNGTRTDGTPSYAPLLNNRYWSYGYKLKGYKFGEYSENTNYNNDPGVEDEYTETNAYNRYHIYDYEEQDVHYRSGI